MFTAVLGTAGASKSTTVISNYYLLGHKLMSLSIIGPIFPILLASNIPILYHHID